MKILNSGFVEIQKWVNLLRSLKSVVPKNFAFISEIWVWFISNASSVFPCKNNLVLSPKVIICLIRTKQNELKPKWIWWKWFPQQNFEFSRTMQAEEYRPINADFVLEDFIQKRRPFCWQNTRRCKPIYWLLKREVRSECRTDKYLIQSRPVVNVWRLDFWIIF